MALINCPECGKGISDKAENCPNCGFPINQPDDKYMQYEDNQENKELGVSIASLVCYILSVIFNVLSQGLLAGILAIACIILVIISFSKKGKCICANIVFWINTLAFILVIVCGIVLTKI